MNLSDYTSAGCVFLALFSLKNTPFAGVNKSVIETPELLLMTTFLLLQNERFIKTISAFLSINQTGQWLWSYIAKSQNVRSRNKLLYIQLAE
jgi:hypothetical protein